MAFVLGGKHRWNEMLFHDVHHAFPNAVGTMSQRGRFHGWQKVHDAAAEVLANGLWKPNGDEETEMQKTQRARSITLMSPPTAAFSFPSPRQGVQSLFRCEHKQSLLVFPSKRQWTVCVFHCQPSKLVTQICGWPQEPPRVNLLCFCGIFLLPSGKNLLSRLWEADANQGLLKSLDSLAVDVGLAER